MGKDLTYYKNCFANLHLNNEKGRGFAPHKPILLLSIIALFQGKYITNNQIFFNKTLIDEFGRNWESVDTRSFVKSIMKPYYHMQYEPFWRLKANLGCEEAVKDYRRMYSMKNLIESVQYAEIDDELAEILKTDIGCTEFSKILFDNYLRNNSNDNSNYK